MDDAVAHYPYGPITIATYSSQAPLSVIARLDQLRCNIGPSGEFTIGE